jgi:glycosyltransferase involved in cell wall biosynthesis
MTLFFRPSGVVVMANYAPFPVFGRKTVIMRHPYLVDDSQDEELGLLRQILERARRVVFWMTLKTTDELVVQSQLMKQLIYEKYSSLNCRVSVLPNPLIKTNVSDSSKNIEHVAQCLTADFAALYVSRYYVHKNHDFILQICKTYKNELLREGVKFYVTLDINATPEASSFLSAIEQLELGDIIVNLGERPREELTSLYQEASCLFFPSKAETFGNPLVEAMDSGLPVVVPDMPYAKAICEEAAAYYKTDDVESAFSVICRLIKSREFRDELNEKGQKRASAFPGPTAWLNKVVEISSGEVRN